MVQNNSLINIGDLSKPATALIEKISEAVGEIFKPWQIRRVAKAEADAEIVHALAKIKIQELQRRALRRFIQEETIKQQNIENITAKAIPELSVTANPKDIENDWIMHFFDKSKIISDEDMQELWAKILAGEANAPGSYSKRTIEVISLMSKKDANLFISLCRFTWKIGNFCPLIFDVKNNIYNDESINFNSLTHLENIGLLTFNVITGFQRVGLPKKGMVSYFDTKVNLEFPNEKDNQLPLGCVLLSQAGQELVSICGAEPKDGFIDYVKEQWSKEKIVFNLLKQ